MSQILENNGQLEISGVLSTWRMICSQLATHYDQDDQLRLTLVCSAATKETVTQFLAPIQTLPRLKELKIRMGPYRNLGLQRMVMTTIQQKTRYFPQQPGKTFPFFRLPVELQISILEYSGLIAPKTLMLQGVHLSCQETCLLFRWRLQTVPAIFDSSWILKYSPADIRLEDDETIRQYPTSSIIASERSAVW
ncbi:hypothetical protein BDW59DRAFT_130891 [Aspergillus cavernicola]|uniref:F-box domain-containing protein n=1 Tax=Aspergillus cavernicola TaxID=176166 RepID=A0ABR4IX40_9EURO